MDVSITYSDAIGNVKLHHTFNGAAPIGRGWMICNGSIINQTNYDALHGAGAYVRDGVGSGPLVGKSLPNFVNKYAVGASATTQTGVSAITSVGLTGHILNVSTHNHKFYESNASNVDDTVWDSSGNVAALNLTFKDAGQRKHIEANNGTNDKAGSLGDAWTENDGAISQSIQPESIEMLYIICVI